MEVFKMAFKIYKSSTHGNMLPEMQSFTKESIIWAKIIHPDDTKSMADLLVNKMTQNYGEGWNVFIQSKGKAVEGLGTI